MGELCELATRHELDREALRGLIAFASLLLVDARRYDDALRLLRAAENRGLLDERLARLKERLAVSLELEEAGANLLRALDRVFDSLERGEFPPALLEELGESIREYERAAEKAERAGLEGDQLLALARDVYNILNARLELDGLLQDFQAFGSQFIDYLSRAEAVRSFQALTAYLSGFQRFAGRIAQLIARVEEALDRLSSIKPETDTGRTLLTSITGALARARDFLRISSLITATLSTIGSALPRIEEMIVEAYRNPGASPFGGARGAFVSLVETVLRSARELEEQAQRYIAEGVVGSRLTARPPDTLAGTGEQAGLDTLIGLAEAAKTIAQTVVGLMRQLKTQTTYSDYRWNSLWEEAEQRAGVDLGSITPADYQRKELVCDESGRCTVREREGILGWIAERAPEELLRFWTTVENVVRSIEMYNSWTMRYGANPLLRALAHVGYFGSTIISGLAGLLAPKLLVEPLQGLKALAGEWWEGIREGNLEKIREAAGLTWKAFFGSREAAIATLGALLLTGGSLLALARKYGGFRNMLRNLTFKEALLLDIAGGDPIGLLMTLGEKTGILARAAAGIRALVGAGRVSLASLASRAELIARALDKARRAKMLEAIASVGEAERILSEALRKADTLFMARQALPEAVERVGLERIAEAASKYQASKMIVESSLAELKARSPGLTDRIRSGLSRLKRGEKPESLPESLSERLPELDAARAQARIRELETMPGHAKLLQLADTIPTAETSARLLKKLERAAEILRREGIESGAVSIERLRRAVELLAEETGRLAELKRSLDLLAEAAERGRSAGLWRETIELSRRKLPGRGWLRKARVNLGERIAEYRAAVEVAYRRRLGLLEALENQIDRLLGELEEAAWRFELERLAGDLAGAFESAGFPGLAEQVRAAASAGAGGLLGRIAEAVGSVFSRILARAETLAGAGVEEIARLRRERLVERGVPGPVADALARAYARGVLAGRRLAQLLLRVSETISRLAGRGGPLTGAERRILGSIEDALRAEAGRVSRERIELLKGVRDALKAFERTPYARLLEEVYGALERRIRILEKQGGPGLGREAALEELRRTVGERILRAADRIEAQLERMTERLESLLQEKGVSPEIIDRVDRLVMEGHAPEEAVESALHGLELGGEARRLLVDYAELRRIAGEISEAARAALGSPVELTRLLDSIAALARLDIEAALGADWALLRGYLRELAPLAREAEEAARRLGLEEMASKLERVARGLRESVTVETPRYTGEVQVALGPGAGRLVEGLRMAYDALREALGEERVRGLGRLIGELEEKLSRGIVDPVLLIRIKDELLKIKLRGAPLYIKYRLLGALDRIKRAVQTLTGRREAARIEKALEEVSGEIERFIREITPPEKGYLGLDAVVGVRELRTVRAPPEVAERLARILAEKRKTWELRSADGTEIRVTRTIDRGPGGKLVIRYDLEFTGGRKASLQYTTTPTGVYAKILYLDPELRAELARLARGTAEAVEGEARTLWRILEGAIRELDTDLALLERVVLPSGRSLARALAQASARALAEALLLSSPLLSAHPGAEEEYIRAATSIARSIVQAAETGQVDPALLSFTTPQARKLSDIYNRMSPRPGEEEIASINLSELEDTDYSVIIPGAPTPDPDRIELVVPGPGSLPGLFDPSLPRAIVNTPWGPVFLPARITPDGVKVYLPPFTFEIPGELEDTLEDLLQGEAQLEKPALPEKPEEKTVPGLEGQEGRTRAPRAPPPLPGWIPTLPWPLGAVAGGSWRERERLNII